MTLRSPLKPVLRSGFRTAVAASSSAAIQPLRAATMFNRVASGFAAVAGTQLQVKSRIGFVIGAGNLSQIVLSFYNWRTDPAGIVLNTNAFTIVSAALEIDGGISVPVLFSGGRSQVVSAGGNDVKSDAILPASFSLGSFANGTKFWLRMQVSLSTAGHTIPQGIPYEGAGGGAFPNWVGFAYDPAVNVTTGPVDGTGAMALGSAFSALTRPVFPVVLGRYTSGSPYVWLGIGDSIMQGLSDTLEGDTYGFSGFFHRSLVNAGLNGAYGAGINMGSSGTTHSMWSGTNNALGKVYWGYCNAAIDNYGTNNFAGGAALATVQADSQALWTAIRAAGPSTILRAHILPRTNTTDNWQTAGANQTGVNAAFNSGGLVAQYNTWLATQVGASTGITEPVPFTGLKDATFPEDWVVTGAAFYATPDGVHPSLAGHVLMATELRTAIAIYPYDADALARFTAVEAAGYTYVATAKPAISTMIAGLKTDSVWTKLTDIHLLAGVSQLAGALMPLKTSVSGLTSITATGFVAGDYIASGPDCGLNDYDNTRFTGSPGLLTAKSMHIGAVTPAAVSGYGIFGFDRHNGNLMQPVTGSFPLLYHASTTQIGAGLYGFGGTDFIQQNGRTGQDVFMNRSSTTAMALYVNGASIGTAAGASATSPGSGNMNVMMLGASNVQCGGRSRAAYWIAAGISNAEGISIRGRIATALATMGRTTGVLTTVFEGDSLTYGTGVGVTPYSDYLKVQAGWGGRPVNVAYNSETVSTGLSQYATQVLPFRPDSLYSTRSLLFVWYGTNELNNGVAATTIQTDLNTYWAGARADGFRVIAFTILPRADGAWSGADETQRMALNISIRAASANYDRLIDVATFDGTSGTPDFSNPSSTVNYLADALHLNSAGELALANWIFANVNPLTV